MSLARVQSFSVSLDWFGTGEGLSLEGHQLASFPPPQAGRLSVDILSLECH
jgi:hypothetical protein